MRDLQPLVDAADDQRLLAPVELEGLTQLEAQRHIGVAQCDAALAGAPLADVVGQPAVAAGIARRDELRKQRLGGAPLLLRPARVGQQGLLHGLDERGKLGGHRRAPVLGASALPMRRYLRTVLRAKLVALTISRTDFFSR
jgi:hypothetical protein